MARSIATAVFMGSLLCGTAAADPVFNPDPQARIDVVDVGHVVPVPPKRASWLDVGLLYGRIEPTRGLSLATEFVRFGPRVEITHFFYVGAELDVGRLGGVDSSAGDTIARDSVGAANQTVSPAIATGGGTWASAKALVGVHAMLGPFSGAAEFAGGIRTIMTTDAVGQFGQGYLQGAYEAHARLDFWPSRGLSIGAIAGVDLADSKDVDIGLVLGIHFQNHSR